MYKNKFPLAKILILVTILAVPGFLYYLLQAKGKNRYKPLPIFGPKEVAATFYTKRGKKIPDTIYHQIPATQLISSTGDSINIKDFKGKITVVNFFYSKNKNVLPQINEGLSSIYDEFKDNKLIKFLSISVDPRSDSVKALKDYAKALKAKKGKWEIGTADTSITYPLIRDQFFVNVLHDPQDTSKFIFSDKLILLDADQRIRGYYTATSFNEIKRLSDEIKVLITEELRKIKLE
ncbi:SCO family protein [Pedobacter sp. SD-b]|uniref:SCO family protein n=1 Tax=Pedobacter segetis TaxID=2793069 RepID=A0ABS1BKL6_9SPHI|nr:SCO family protein [Pedobacter segetis]MBK0383348.1 SCO family protein [Pedobacter segetis]